LCHGGPTLEVRDRFSVDQAKLREFLLRDIQPASRCAKLRWGDKERFAYGHDLVTIKLNITWRNCHFVGHFASGAADSRCYPALGVLVMRSFFRTRSEPIAIETDLSKDRLAEAARQAVKSSLKAEFRADPLFRPEISKLISVCTSGVIRHGPLIECAISEALEKAGLTILRNVHVPVTHGALAMVGSDKYSQIAADQFPFDESDIADYVDADIIAIDEKNRCAGAFSVKRGGGAAGTRKRTSDDRALRAMGFTLASWLRQQGYRMIDSALAMVIDFYGQSGFPKDITVDRTELDDFFEVSVVAEVERMTEVMRATIDAEIRCLLQPILRTMTPPPDKPLSAPRPTNSGRPNPPRRTRPRWGGEAVVPAEAVKPARTFVARDRSS